MKKSTSENGKPLVPQTKLLNGYTAPTEFYERLQAHIAKQIPNIQPDTLYILKIICGDKFWDGLPNNWWKRLAGRCFAHMVSKKLLPFEFVQLKHKTKHYILK